MDMGDRIRKLRKDKGITQEELGKVIGVQKSAIRKYEAGAVKNLKQSSMKKLGDFFSVTPSYLMGWEDTPTAEEMDLLNKYRKLQNCDKKAVKALLSTVNVLLGIEDEQKRL